MAMNKPIILDVEGEVKNMILESKLDICIEPENAHRVVDDVLKLADDEKLASKYGKKYRQFVAQNYGRQVHAGQFQKLLIDVIG